MQPVTGKQSTCTGASVIEIPCSCISISVHPQDVVIVPMVLPSQFIYHAAFRLKSLGQEQFLTFCAAGLDFAGDVSAKRMQSYHVSAWCNVLP